MRRVKEELIWIGYEIVNMFRWVLFPEQTDKAKHQLGGMYLMIIGLALNEFINPWVTFISCTALIIAYEFYQMFFNKGKFEFLDILRGFIGICFVGLWYLVAWEIGK